MVAVPMDDSPRRRLTIGRVPRAIPFYALTAIFSLRHIRGMFEVLAEPNRRRILDLLREAERAVGDLVAELGMSQPGVSKHLRVLREAGLVEVRVDAQRR